MSDGEIGALPSQPVSLSSDPDSEAEKGSDKRAPTVTSLPQDSPRTLGPIDALPDRSDGCHGHQCNCAICRTSWIYEACLREEHEKLVQMKLEDKTMAIMLKVYKSGVSEKAKRVRLWVMPVTRECFAKRRGMSKHLFDKMCEALRQGRMHPPIGKRRIRMVDHGGFSSRPADSFFLWGLVLAEAAFSQKT